MSLFLSRRILTAVSVIVISNFLASEARSTETVLKVWPGQAPGEREELGPEKEVVRKEAVKATRITNIDSPTLIVSHPPKEKQTGTLVVVCPGGGYNYVVVDKEGTEIVAWLNSIGVSGALLKYRVPARKDRPKYEAPLQDAQRSIRLLRKQAETLGIRADRIGIMGFSAGGHVAACASTNFEKSAYEPIDDVDTTDCQPNFAMLIYPAYLSQRNTSGPETLSPELPVSSKTPPTFLMMTQDDGVRVESALTYYLAAKIAKVPLEMHLYPSGGHGYGLRLEGHNAATWPKRAEDWLKSNGWLDR